MQRRLRLRFDFSAAFLRIIPPDTNFGEAWESLCYELLAAERGADNMLRLAPPDRGIDILDQRSRDAFQCKSVELGASGTLPVKPSIDSLSTACVHRTGIPWKKYVFATNGRYTGSAQEEISTEAARLGLTPQDDVMFLGPEYWAECCERHFDRIKDRLHYSVTVAELQIIEAFRKARYFPQYVREYSEKIARGGYKLVVTNNRTPVELEIPFAPELSIENCLDVAKQLLGISLEWTSFDDLNTSAGPSLSITLDGYAQGFSKTLGELGIKSGDKVQLWIKIVWRDGLDDATPSSSDTYAMFRLQVPRASVGIVHDRGKLTVARKERIIQAMMWNSAARLARGDWPDGSA
jgi:hypothetical protein